MDISTVTIRTQDDIDALEDMDDMAKKAMSSQLKQYSQFAFVRDTGYIFAAVSREDGLLLVNLDTVFFEKSE